MRDHPAVLAACEWATVKILYLLTRELDGTGAALRHEHAQEHSVVVIDLLRETNYGRVVDEIAAADRIISW